jgi:Tripartite tricarboxylate transporter family receptor
VAKLKMIGFAGSADSITAVIGGHVEGTAAPASLIAAQVATGRLRALGVGPLADVPTWREQGIDAVVSNWRGIVGPRDMTAAQIAYWDDVFAKTVATAEWKEELERTQLEQHYLDSKTARGFPRQRAADGEIAATPRCGLPAHLAEPDVRAPLPACGERSARACAPGEGASPRARAVNLTLRLADRPPHPDPLPASGAREKRRCPIWQSLNRQLPSDLQTKHWPSRYPTRCRSMLWRRHNEVGLELRRHIPCCGRRPIAAAAASGRPRRSVRVCGSTWRRVPGLGEEQHA